MASKYIILDTETTGTKEEDRIIQLGYLVLDGKKVDVYNEFNSCDVDIKIPAMEVHGITPELLEGKPPCTQTNAYKTLEVLNESSNYMIIHNAPFDIAMLNKEGFNLKMKLIDTLRVAKHVFADEEFHRLQYFRYKFKLYQKEEAEAAKLGIVVKAHDAIGDVLVLKLFLTILRQKVNELYPQDNPVEKMVELTNTPVFYKKPLRFGKHKGKTLQELAIEDSGYLRWMLEKMDGLDDDMRYSIHKVLDF